MMTAGEPKQMPKTEHPNTRKCPAPIISLTRGASEQRVDGAGYHLDPDPERLLKLTAEITHHKAAA
jgi:hypothetical protein